MSPQPQKLEPMIDKHVVLLGDSVFDNVRYVAGGLPVIEHLREQLPAGWRATLLAIDGDVASDVMNQIVNLPIDTTHLVISAGGNDALNIVEFLRQPVQSMLEALDKLSVPLEAFRQDYRAMLETVLAKNLPVAVCTIYDSIPGMTPAIRKGIALFNDVIIREAMDAGVQIIDLRSVCSDAGDYSVISPIELSEQGGAKIARAIVSSVRKCHLSAGVRKGTLRSHL